MKYKVGDKVKVKEDLEIGETYGGLTFSVQMREYRGQIVTIKTADDDSYQIEEDELNWYWTEEMLEDVEEKLKEADYGIEVVNEQNKIEELETKLKNKQSEIDFLKGQISVYEKFLNSEEV